MQSTIFMIRNFADIWVKINQFRCMVFPKFIIIVIRNLSKYNLKRGYASFPQKHPIYTLNNNPL